jgi:WD40 repeat protein
MIRICAWAACLTAGLWSFDAASTMPGAGSKPLSLTLVWTRIADHYGEAGSVESVEFSPDGERLVSGSKFDNRITLWRVTDGTELARAARTLEIERVTFAPDGSVIAVAGEDREVALLDPSTLAERATLPHDNGIDALVFSPDGRWLASGSEYTEDGAQRSGWLRLWSIPAGTLSRRVDLGETINNLDFDRAGKRLLASGERGRAALYSVPDLKRLHDIEGDPDWHFIAGRISPDGRWLAIGDERGDIRVFDAATGELKRLFNHSGSKLETLRFTPDGRYLYAAGNDPYIRAWRLADILSNVRLAPALMQHAFDAMEYLDFSPNGALLASAHQDGAVRLWIIMGEDMDLNERRHRQVRREQDQAFE